MASPDDKWHNRGLTVISAGHAFCLLLASFIGVQEWINHGSLVILANALWFALLTLAVSALWFNRVMGSARPAMKFQFVVSFSLLLLAVVTEGLVLIPTTDPGKDYEALHQLRICLLTWDNIVAAIAVWWFLRRRADGRGRDKIEAPVINRVLRPMQVMVREVEQVVLANDPLYKNNVKLLRETDLGFLIGNFRELIGAKFDRARSDMISTKRRFFDVIDFAWNWEKHRAGPKVEDCGVYHAWSWGEIVDRVEDSAAT